MINYDQIHNLTSARRAAEQVSTTESRQLHRYLEAGGRAIRRVVRVDQIQRGAVVSRNGLRAHHLGPRQRRAL